MVYLWTGGSWPGRHGAREPQLSRTLPPIRQHLWAVRAGWILLGLLLVALPAPAQAATLVSNLGQGTTTLRQTWFDGAQGFQTGPQRAGYSLTSVQLHMDSFGDPTTIVDLRVSLRTRATAQRGPPKQHRLGDIRQPGLHYH